MLYNFGIIAYRCAIGVASLFNESGIMGKRAKRDMETDGGC